jgi:resuscitation-promoting factor RpfA
MTKKPTLIHPALAAIAAVIACSNVPAMAQETQTVTPPAMTAPVPEAAPVAPAPVAAAPATAAPVQTGPVVKFDGPVVPTITGEEAAANATQSVAKARPKPQTGKTGAKTQTVAPVAVAPEASDPPSASDNSIVEDAGSSTAVATSPVALAESGQEAGDVNGDKNAASITPIAPSDTDWEVIGGIAGALGIAGLGGVLYARRRKTVPVRGDAYDSRIVATDTPLRVNTVAVAEPVTAQSIDTVPNWVHAPRHATVGKSAHGATRSYLERVDDGPIAENPFLTRKNRLRRARFLDARNETNAMGVRNGNQAPTPQTRERQSEREYENA